MFCSLMEEVISDKLDTEPGTISGIMWIWKNQMNVSFESLHIFHKSVCFIYYLMAPL